MNYYPNNISDGVVDCLYRNSMTFSMKVAYTSAVLTPMVAPLLVGVATNRVVRMSTIKVFVGVLVIAVVPITVNYTLGCVCNGGSYFPAVRDLVPNVDMAYLTVVIKNIVSAIRSSLMTHNLSLFL